MPSLALELHWAAPTVSFAISVKYIDFTLKEIKSVQADGGR